MPLLINSPGILLTCPLTALTEHRNQEGQRLQAVQAAGEAGKAPHGY